MNEIPPWPAGSTAAAVRMEPLDAVITVWLWDAPGPVSSALGVCDKEAEARRAAAARLLGGLTPAAVIERANQEAPWLSS